MENLQTLYDNYVSLVCKLMRERKLGEGIFGSKGGPKDHPCHDRFANDLRAYLDELRSRGPQSAAVKGTLEWIYRAPKRYSEPQLAYWMMVAVHSLTFDVIELLSAEDADDLLKVYSEEFKRWELMPVQKQLIKKLKEQKASGK